MTTKWSNVAHSFHDEMLEKVANLDKCTQYWSPARRSWHNAALPALQCIPHSRRRSPSLPPTFMSHASSDCKLFCRSSLRCREKLQESNTTKTPRVLNEASWRNLGETTACASPRASADFLLGVKTSPQQRPRSLAMLSKMPAFGLMVFETSRSALFKTGRMMRLISHHTSPSR